MALNCVFIMFIFTKRGRKGPNVADTSRHRLKIEVGRPKSKKGVVVAIVREGKSSRVQIRPLSL